MFQHKRCRKSTLIIGEHVTSQGYAWLLRMSPDFPDLLPGTSNCTRRICTPHSQVSVNHLPSNARSHIRKLPGTSKNYKLPIIKMKKKILRGVHIVVRLATITGWGAAPVLLEPPPLLGRALGFGCTFATGPTNLGALRNYEYWLQS